MAIDYDRGCHIRIHGPTGMRVFMYVDEPGVFRSVHGSEVDPQLAAEAGFDTERLLREKLKRERLAAAGKAIETEFDGAAVAEVIAEKHGFKVVHIGLGKHNVLDPEDVKLNVARPLTKEEAKALLAKVAQPAPKQVPTQEAA